MHVIVKDRTLLFIVRDFLSGVHVYCIFFVCSPDGTGVGMDVLVTVGSCREFPNFCLLGLMLPSLTPLA